MINPGGQSLVPEISLYQTNSAHMEMSNWLWNIFFIFLNNHRKLLLKEKDFCTEKSDRRLADALAQHGDVHTSATPRPMMDVTYEVSGKNWHQITDRTACNRTCCRSVRSFNQTSWLLLVQGPLCGRKGGSEPITMITLGWMLTAFERRRDKEPVSPFPDGKGGIL